MSDTIDPRLVPCLLDLIDEYADRQSHFEAILRIALKRIENGEPEQARTELLALLGGAE